MVELLLAWMIEPDASTWCLCLVLAWMAESVLMVELDQLCTHAGELTANVRSAFASFMVLMYPL